MTNSAPDYEQWAERQGPVCEKLMALLCDPYGNVCIGSDEDKRLLSIFIEQVHCLDEIADHIRDHRDMFGTVLNDLLDELDRPMSKIPPKIDIDSGSDDGIDKDNAP